MNNWKRVLSGILTAAMLTASLSAAAMAADPAPAGQGGASGGGGMPGMSSASPATKPDDFADKASITNLEAVSALMSMGVINGVSASDGNRYFYPSKNITRAEMAKMIGTAAAAAAGGVGSETDTGFTDVASSSWAAPYVAYCKEHAIIDGDGDGLFDPTSSITGVQTAKLLLAALGNTSLTGSDWAAETKTAAKAAGLFDGVTNIDTALTRDEAAGMIYAALKSSDGKGSLPKLELVTESKTGDLTIDANTVLVAPAGKTLTLIVDGVDTAIAAGTYKNAELFVGDGDYTISSGGPGGSFTWVMRMGLYVKDGKIQTAYSAADALKGGTVTDTAATGVTITSKTDKFNGIVLGGSSAYTIDGANFDFTGNGGSDFQGIGAVIMAADSSNVTVKNTRIHTDGAIRTAIWAGDTAKVNVSNTVIDTLNADTSSESYKNLKVNMMKQVPWALGLEGNVRSTNVLGQAQATYSDSIVVSEGWGALSTDSGQSPTSLTCSNVLSGIGTLEVAQKGKTYTATKTVNGVTYGFTVGEAGKSSGYVTYADGGVTNTYNNCEFYAPDYILISPAGASSGGNTFNGGTYVSSRIGVMWHQSQQGVTTIKGGTWSAADTMFLAKSTSGNTACPILTVDGAAMSLTGQSAYSGTLYQLMDSDDAGGILARSYTVPEQENNWATVKTISDKTTAAVATFKDLTATGNIFNSVYTVNQDLDITLDNATINGMISSSTANHADASGKIIAGGTVIHDTDNNETGYLYAGRLINNPAEAVNNGVVLTMKNKAVWNVTGTSYLTGLTLEAGSTVNGTITVDGKTVKDPGTYTGTIVVTKAS